MKPASFSYISATTASEAVAALSEYGPDAKVLAGGQSLIPILNFRLARPGFLIDLGRANGLNYIRKEENRLLIGSMTRHRQLELSPVTGQYCPLLAEALPYIGHVSIRNQGTMGGTLAHADPAAEIPLVAMALDAEFVIQGPAGSRTVPASEFFLSIFTTALQADELLTEARFPVASPYAGHAFLEFSRRHGDFALAGVACVLTPDIQKQDQIAEARLALLGVGDTPIRATRTESRLIGEKAGSEAFRAASASVLEEIDPISDLHATATYRRHLAGILTHRALDIAWSRAQRRLQQCTEIQ